MDMYPYIRVDMRLHSCPNARIHSQSITRIQQEPRTNGMLSEQGTSRTRSSSATNATAIRIAARAEGYFVCACMLLSIYFFPATRIAHIIDLGSMCNFPRYTNKT